MQSHSRRARSVFEPNSFSPLCYSKGRSPRQAGKDSPRRGMNGSLAKRERSNLAFASIVRRLGAEGEEGDGRPGDQLQRRAPWFTEALASSDS